MPLETQIRHLTESDFADATSQGIAVVDFWAAWCGPCRAMAPQLDRAAASRPNYLFGKVDVDAETTLAARFGIQSIPTLIVFRDGEPIASHSGLISADQLVEALDRIAAATDAEADTHGHDNHQEAA